MAEVAAPASRLPMVGADDTIVALATPAGRSAMAIVRMSGPQAHEIAARVLAPWPIEPRVATLCSFHDPVSREIIDRPLVLAYESPRSYTGEPVVEIMAHGGLLVPAELLGALVAAGARQALPGEFTRRAVLNGKLDLLQAEAIGDLIDARSRGMHRSALSQLDGGLSRRVLSLRHALLEIEALLAYDIDFPEEDDGPIPRERILESAREVERKIAALLATVPFGELMREGALVVLAGAPNVGKSSLFNALLGRARAIVTDVPGTTRDALEAVIDGGEFPLRLVDTAGLRSSADLLERLGIEVSERYLADADLVLACGDDPRTVATAVERVRALTEAPAIAVRTKSDLDSGASAGTSAWRLSADGTPDGAAPEIGGPVAVSAETGEGLAELVERIRKVLSSTVGAPSADVPVLTRARHRVALAAASCELEAFRRAWVEERLPATVAAVHVHAATAALEELIGSVDVEDVLERVFSSFCVGK